MMKLISLLILLTACTTTDDHRRRILQDYYSDCQVSDDLVITCPADLD